MAAGRAARALWAARAPLGQQPILPSTCLRARLLQVSVQLFAAHRAFHEGQLTKRKDQLVANRCVYAVLPALEPTPQAGPWA